MKRRTWLARTCLVLALVPACGGGQTGDLSGENSKHGKSTGSDDGCDDHATDIAQDDSAALGFSAASVLTFAEQPFESAITWQSVQGATYSPDSSQSTLTLKLSSLGKAQLVHSTPHQSSSGSEATIDLICPPDRLKVAVHAELGTSDGALLESFDGDLEAASEHFATFKHALELGKLSGTFAAAPSDTSTSTKSAIVGLALDATLAPGGIAGNLTAQLTSTGNEVSSVSFLTFARFPDDPACPTAPGTKPALPVTADNAALGFSGNAALARLRDSGALPLEWATGESTELELVVSGLSVGCLRADVTHYASSTPSATVTYPISLKAKTTDGKLNASYAANLVTWPTPDGNGYVERLELNQQFDTLAVAQTGFTGVTVPASAQRLAVSIQALYEGTSQTGSVRLDALADPPCVTDPPPPQMSPDGSYSSSGCSGTMVTSLINGTWSAARD